MLSRYRAVLLLISSALALAPEDAFARSETHSVEARRRPAKKKKIRRADKDEPGSSRLRSHASPAKPNAPRVHIERPDLKESMNVRLVDAKGRPDLSADRSLSALARLRGAHRPSVTALQSGKHKGDRISIGAAMMHPGLLLRLDKIARHFPKHTISIVSGYRPQSEGSLHQQARALDIHLTGVKNEELVAFCKTLTDTGCGYYPNSSFVHVDVRDPGAGHVTWIDSSGPGQKAHYVASWPPPPGVEAPPADAPPPISDDMTEDFHGE